MRAKSRCTHITHHNPSPPQAQTYTIYIHPIPPTLKHKTHPSCLICALSSTLSATLCPPSFCRARYTLPKRPRPSGRRTSKSSITHRAAPPAAPRLAPRTLFPPSVLLAVVRVASAVAFVTPPPSPLLRGRDFRLVVVVVVATAALCFCFALPFAAAPLLTRLPPLSPPLPSPPLPPPLPPPPQQLSPLDAAPPDANVLATSRMDVQSETMVEDEEEEEEEEEEDEEEEEPQEDEEEEEGPRRSGRHRQ